MESFLRLSQKASENDINLNDHVERNELFRPLHGGYTTVYQGTIRSTQQEVAIKAIRHSPSEDNDACDVRASGYCRHFLTDCHLAHHRRNT